MLFAPNLRDSVTALQKSSLIYWFTCKFNICYTGLTNQCLEIRIKQHIPSSIQTHTSDYTTTPSSYNSTSAIGCHLLTNQTCACVYSHTMFVSHLEDINKWNAAFHSGSNSNEKNSNQNCVSKSNPILHCFSITFSDHHKKKIINSINSASLQ